MLMFATNPAIGMVFQRLCLGALVLLCGHWQLATASLMGETVCCQMQWVANNAHSAHHTKDKLA